LLVANGCVQPPYGRTLTWGQFNEGVQTIATQTKEKLIQANAEIDSQLQEQHESEIAQRQRTAKAVGAALQEWSDQQQQIALAAASD
jgi:hypothetical protein